MFRQGQKVRVKHWKEIAKTLDSGDIFDCNNVSLNQNVHFCSDMKEFCEKEYYIDFIDSSNGHISLAHENMSMDDLHYIGHWVWDEYWLEPIKPEVKLPEELFNVA